MRPYNRKHGKAHKRLASMALAGASFSVPEAPADSADPARWLAAANLAADFQPAANREEFEQQRREIRATIWTLLGDLPPRPPAPAVRILSQEALPECRVE